jgi:ABC-type branched-subunit amino acid transport system ATPase component
LAVGSSAIFISIVSRGISFIFTINLEIYPNPFMQKAFYIKIQNFKVYGEEITITLDNSSILIGANNSGKTSAIQALALWNWAVKIWFEKKKNTKSNTERNKGVALNRLEIAQVPIKETRYFWNQAKVRQNSNDNIGLTITVGLWFNGAIREVGMLFKYHSPDLMYCQPTNESYEEGLLEYANGLKVNLLYPMSGITDREFVFQEEAIRTQIGIGQTANVLRNICYHLSINNKGDWEYLVSLMKLLFSVEIKNPFVRATGAIELMYNYSEKSKKADYDLDITLAGRGQQQMLLVLAYLMANKDAILLIDEPDAHLEILRQSQIYSAIKDVAQKYNCQIVIVTHSEVVLNEADSVNFIMDGRIVNVPDKNDYKFVRNALKDFGIEHYYKAKVRPNILYIESSTDVRMLRTFAENFAHKSFSVFEDKLNFYYTKNNYFEENLETDIQKKSGSFKHFRQHFNALKITVPELKGIGLFDSDNKSKVDEVHDDFGLFFWKKYELENYFISPKTILSFAKDELERRFGEGLFSSIVEEKLVKIEKIIDKYLVLPILNDDKAAFKEFSDLPENIRNVQFQNLSSTKKMSELADSVFTEISKQLKEPILLNKGEYHQLIPYLETLPSEVKEKLDYLDLYLRNDK